MDSFVKEYMFQSPLRRSVDKLNNKVTETIIGGMLLEILYLKHVKTPVPWKYTRVMRVKIYVLDLGTVLSSVM
jgi:hypothetical protein